MSLDERVGNVVSFANIRKFLEQSRGIRSVASSRNLFWFSRTAEDGMLVLRIPEDEPCKAKIEHIAGEGRQCPSGLVSGSWLLTKHVRRTLKFSNNLMHDVSCFGLPLIRRLRYQGMSQLLRVSDQHI